MAGKYLLTTLGCKVNQYESQQIRELFESLGLRSAGHGEVPNIAVVNTCAVTAEASRKTRQALRRLARRGCSLLIAVGCASTHAPERLRAIDGVTDTIGHDVNILTELRRLIAQRLHGISLRSANHTTQATTARLERPNANRNDVWMIPLASGSHGRAPTREITKPPTQIVPRSTPAVKANGALAAGIESFAGHQRAFLKVQDGCDACCTYCIIPRLRPKLRWKPIETAVGEARQLVRSGHREIIVTGIFLGAYGRGTAMRDRFRGEGSPLARLIDALCTVEGLERLRLSSLEPGDVDEALLAALARHDACVPHLHLPLQSGSERILRRMRRQYGRDAFVAMIDRVRSALDRPAITTDILVGFPGETEEDFQASLDVARYEKFAKIHAFRFSPRNGTVAARWRDNFVDPGEVRERMRRLTKMERDCGQAFRRSFLGCVERVIVEKDGNLGGGGTGGAGPMRHGRCDRYFEVRFEAPDARPGDVVSVRIDRVTPTRTYGTRVS